MLFNKLEMIQSELRHQRQDHVTLQHDIEKIRLDLNLKQQADEYYKDHGPPSTQGMLEDNMNTIPEDSQDLD